MKQSESVDPKDAKLIQTIIGDLITPTPTLDEIIESISRLRESKSTAVVPDVMTDCLTIRQVADILNVSTDTVRRRIADGTFRAVKIARSVRIPRSEIEKLLQTPSEG